MQKILVIGCPGGGKSTFARALRDKTGLPLVYLDRIWHKPDGTQISHVEFETRLEEVLCGDRWIIDGNYLRTMERRLQACDTVFLLDYPLEVCLAGAASRVGRPHEDLPWVETTFDPEFRRWIEDFSQKQLPVIHALLDKYRQGRTLHIFHARTEADAWLESCSAGNGEV